MDGWSEYTRNYSGTPQRLREIYSYMKSLIGRRLKSKFAGNIDTLPFGSQKVFEREYHTLAIVNLDSSIEINEMADNVRKNRLVKRDGCIKRT